HEGRPHRSHELEAARLQRFKKGSGLPLRLPVIELIEIGAGGGSIAAPDPLGLLRVGPRSAGAVPGPACYAQGGEEPTVTDADLIRGYLSPERFLGGRMRLDLERARAAVSRLGEKLGLGLAETAAGIASVVDNNMATAARVHIAEAGTDPNRYRMVAFGGAGPAHAYSIARLLNLDEVIFPLGAGVASAIGMLVAPRSVEYARSLIAALDTLDWTLVEEIVASLDARARAVLRDGGIADGDITRELSADMRYAGQGFEVNVPLDEKALQRHDAVALQHAFDARYEERFGRNLGAVPIEVVSWRVRLVAPASVSEIRFPEHSRDATSGEAFIEHRSAFFTELHGFVETPVYARDRLEPGRKIAGPALIEEAESTCVVGPMAHVEVDAFGNLIMRLETASLNTKAKTALEENQKR
ncbi:MAG: hydantoinase/oxoprolinase family protein, partial [Hyphomicrobiales bacterium]|nr:hydantoinase/oxoprolinase family protein [Hyphomicrobiales bacterium]